MAGMGELTTDGGRDRHHPDMSGGIAIGLLQRPVVLALLLIVAIAPLAWPMVPPLTDLPGHMGRYAVQLDGGRSPELAQWYTFRWAILPNLGVDLLVQMLAPLMGLRWAVKIIVIGIIALQVMGFIALSRVVHGRVSPLLPFAIPLAYSAPFNFGFVNFALGLALATLVLALWMSDWLRGRPAARWFAFAVLACVLWICHLAAWAVLCLLVGATEMVRRYDAGKRFWPALAAAFVASTCFLLPQALSLFLEPSGRGPIAGFFILPFKIFYLLNVLQDRWDLWDIGSALCLYTLAVWSWCSRHFTLHRGLALGTIILLTAFVFLPQMLFGSAFADMRMVPIMLAMALLAPRPADKAPQAMMQAVALMGCAFLVARMVSSTVSFAMWDDIIERNRRVLDSVPRGSQLVSVVARECYHSPLVFHDRRMHLISYALIDRHAFANDQWVIPGGQLLSVHNADAGRFQTDGSHMATATHCDMPNAISAVAQMIPETVPLFWVIWMVPREPLQGWQVVAESGDSTLYKRVEGQPASALGTD